MNKLYSLVWNRSRQQIEVASELTRSRGCGGARAANGVAHANGLRIAQLALTIMFAFGVLPAALAGTNCAASSATATGTHAVACGPNAKAIGAGASAFGSKASAGMHGTAVGMHSSASSDATAVGESAHASGSASTALGNHAATSGSGAIAAGYGANAAEAGTALGNHAVAAVNGTAVGVQSHAGSDAAAVGERSNAKGVNSAAFGYGANAYSNHTIAIGDGAEAGNASSSLSSLNAIALGTNATATQSDSIAMGHDANASLAGSVALGASSVTAAATPTSSVVIRGVTYHFAGSNPHSVVSVGAPGAERQLINVAAGDVSATSTDAVNGSQLYATNQAIDAIGSVANAGWNLSANGGTGVNIKPGATVDVAQGSNIVVTQAANGNLTIATSPTPSFTTVTTTGDLSVGGDANITGNETVGGNQTVTGNSTIGGTQTVTGMLNANGGLTVAAGQTVDMGGNVVTHVGAGAVNATSTDAVNGSQLYATNRQVGTNTSQIATNTTSITQNTNQIRTNTGQIAGNTTDIAHNTAQINQNTGQISTNSSAIGKLQVASKGAVQYDTDADGSTDYNSVTLNPGGTGPTVIHNVAAGVADNEAVNLGQMNTAIAGAVTQANDYTDQRFTELKGSISQVGDRANAGIASAIAAASIPQPYAPNQSSLGVGLGSFHGEAGIAVGLSKITESGRFILKANVSSDSRGDFGAGIGAGIVW